MCKVHEQEFLDTGLYLPKEGIKHRIKSMIHNYSDSLGYLFIKVFRNLPTDTIVSKPISWIDQLDWDKPYNMVFTYADGTMEYIRYEYVIDAEVHFDAADYKSGILITLGGYYGEL